MMKALVYNTSTGRIVRVQQVSSASTLDEVRDHIWGGNPPSDVTLKEHDGTSTRGKKVDTSTGNLVDDPNYTPPKPAPVRIDPLEFLARFQKSELDNIASSSDKLVKKFEQRIDNSTVIVKDSTLTTGMQYLVNAGLLTATRRDEILNF
jgi:hypothetical protein